MLRSRSRRQPGLGLSTLLVALAVLGPGRALAQTPPAELSAWFAQNYTKRELRIPMRDGVRLFTVVYTPKDASQAYPILLQRTPYSLKPYTVDAGGRPGGFPESYLREKFILARQDVRGRFASEGTFVHVRPYRPTKTGPRDTDESTDAWDTIDWLVKHVPGHNGNVGLQGISYPGFFAAAGMIDSHPALKAVSPQAPAVDIFGGDDVLHGGGFWLAHNFGFMSYFEQKVDDPLHQDPRPFDYRTPDGYRFFLDGGSVAELDARYFEGRYAFWNDFLAHAGDARWCAERDLSRHLARVGAAVLTGGGGSTPRTWRGRSRPIGPSSATIPESSMPSSWDPGPTGAGTSATARAWGR